MHLLVRAGLPLFAALLTAQASLLSAQVVSAPAARVDAPYANLRLRDLGASNDGKMRAWLDETTRTQNGPITTVWMLTLFAADQTVNGKTTTGNWSRASFDCAKKTVALEGMAPVGPAGLSDAYVVAPVRKFGPLTAGTPLETAQKLACTAVSGPALQPTNLVLHFAKFRAGPAKAAPAPQPAPSPVQTPAAITVPQGKLELVDYMVERDKFDGFFRLYAQRGSTAADPGGMWTIEVAPADRPFNVGAGKSIAVAGFWINWVADCNRGELKVRQAAVTSQTGEVVMLRPAAYPPSGDVADTAQNRTLKLPKATGAKLIYNEACPADASMAILGNVKSGLFPKVYTTGTAAIAAARGAQSLNPAQKAAAIPCVALADAVERNAAGIWTENFALTAMRYRMTQLAAMLRQAMGPVDSAALAGAAQQWAGPIAAARAARSGKLLTPALDRCIATVPIGLFAGQFQSAR